VSLLLEAHPQQQKQQQLDDINRCSGKAAAMWCLPEAVAGAVVALLLSQQQAASCFFTSSTTGSSTTTSFLLLAHAGLTWQLLRLLLDAPTRNGEPHGSSNWSPLK
jgi:hypothetical protein